MSSIHHRILQNCRIACDAGLYTLNMTRFDLSLTFDCAYHTFPCHLSMYYASLGYIGAADRLVSTAKETPVFISHHAL